jgi:hypothetical protein
MMGAPVDDSYATMMLEAWGLANRVGGPKGYPKSAAFVYKPHGVDLEWSDHKIEVVGWVVQNLEEEERLIVKLYFEPQDGGKRLKPNAIRKKTSIHTDKIHRALDHCIGRVAQALSMPQYFEFKNNT